MIISRVTFSLKFGQARPAIALWKEIMDHTRGMNEGRRLRLLTDVSGPNYVLVLEMYLRSLTELGTSSHAWLTNEKIRELYPKFHPLCDRSVSEMYHLQHQVGEEPPVGSIIEQMTFRLKFGMTKEGCDIWRRILDAGKEGGLRSRMLTDVTGESYTLIMEQSHRNMMEYGPHMSAWFSNETMKDLYARFIPLCDSSRRTLFKVEHLV